MMVIDDSTVANLKRQCMLIAKVPCKLNDDLHALDFPLDLFVEVLTLHFRETEEVDRSGIFFGLGHGRDEGAESLIEAFC
jgi:hypothetical protein